MTQFTHCPQKPCVQMMRSPTRSGSPSESRSAPSPIAATRPVISWPRMRGKRSLEEPDSPSQRCTSLAQIVAAVLRTSSAPGSSSWGIGTSEMSIGC